MVGHPFRHRHRALVRGLLLHAARAVGPRLRHFHQRLFRSMADLRMDHPQKILPNGIRTEDEGGMIS